MTTCVCGEARCPATGGGFFVTVIDGRRHAFLLGPYETHAEALANVQRGKVLADAADPRAHWYAYGTARVVGEMPKTLFASR